MKSEAMPTIKEFVKQYFLPHGLQMLMTSVPIVPI